MLIENVAGIIDKNMTMELRQYKTIAEHFTCPIHLGKLKDPRRLACEHTFCAECLNGCISTSLSSRNDGMFECAVCRARHHVPNVENGDYARGFPIDAFCVIQLHTLAQYQRSAVCEVHIEKFKEYFCFHHRELLCSDCVIESHTRNPCSCGSLQDSILEVRLQIKELIAKLRMQEDRAQRIISSQSASSHSEDLVKQITEVEKMLTRFYKSTKAKLKESKQTVMETTKVSKLDMEHVSTIKSLISKTREHVETIIRPEKSKRADSVNEVLTIWTPLEQETINFDEALDDIETRPYCVSIKADEEFLKFVSVERQPLFVTNDADDDVFSFPQSPTKEKSQMIQKEMTEGSRERHVTHDAARPTTIQSPTMVRRTISLTTPVLKQGAPKLYTDVDQRPISQEAPTPRIAHSRQVSPSRAGAHNNRKSHAYVLPKVGTGELIARDSIKKNPPSEMSHQLKSLTEESNFELPCGDILLIEKHLIALKDSSIQRFTLDYKYLDSLAVRCPWRMCGIKNTATIAVNHNTRFISIINASPVLVCLYRIETEKPYSEICHFRTQIYEDRFGRTRYFEHLALSHTTDLRADCIDLIKVSYDKNPYSNFTSNQVTKLVPVRTKLLISSDKHSVVRSPNSLAATSDGKRLIIGAESAVVCVRKTGEIIWTRPVMRFVADVCCDRGLVFVCIENEQKLSVLDEAGNCLVENIFPFDCDIVRPNRVSVDKQQMIVREFSETDWKSTVHVFSLNFV